MSEVIDSIGKMGLIPVVVIDDAGLAVPAAEALIAGGLNVMEVTLRTQAAIEAIKRVSESRPEMLIGAGTVLSVKSAEEAVKAGARFIVSPGLNEELTEWCVKNGVDITPGCVTPTEIDRALSLGLKVLKFFPASVYGGVNACKELNGPYRSVSFIPTGGINLATLAEYADKPYIHAVGGGWLCKPDDLKARNFENITNVARESISVLLGFEFAHVGINAPDEASSIAIAKTYASAFNFKLKEGNSSNFAGAGIEVNKSKGAGTMGHIAVRTNSINRAAYYLEKAGFAADMSAAKTQNGRMIALYLKDEIGGFAVHLLQK